MTISFNPKKVIEKLATLGSRILYPFKLKQVSRGNDFPDKRFLVIQCKGYGRGLFSFFYTTLGWIAYAKRNAMIPVVDMRHYRTIYHRRCERGKVNVWECFFEQPARYTLEDIEHAKNITVTNALTHPGEKNFLPSIGSFVDAEQTVGLRQWRHVVSESVKIKDSAIANLTNPKFENIDKSEIIGVLARGTDYIAAKPSGHPIQPSTNDFFMVIDDCMGKGKAKYIFLVTEDKTIADAFAVKYKERLILSNQECIDYSGKGLLVKSKNVSGNLLRGFGYLKAIVDLSHCGSLIAGRTSGTIGALLLSRGFSYTHIFNLGVYP